MLFIKLREFKVLMKEIINYANKLRHIMLINWKAQHNKDVSPPRNWNIGLAQLLSKSQDFLQIDNIILKQCIWKSKGTKTVKASFKKKSKVGVTHLFDFMTLYNYRNQDSVVILKRQTYRSMEQNKGTKNRPIQIYPTNFSQKWKKQFSGGKLFNQVMVE